MGNQESARILYIGYALYPEEEEEEEGTIYWHRQHWAQNANK